MLGVEPGSSPGLLVSVVKVSLLLWLQLVVMMMPVAVHVTSGTDRGKKILWEATLERSNHVGRERTS